MDRITPSNSFRGIYERNLSQVYPRLYTFLCRYLDRNCGSAAGVDRQ